MSELAVYLHEALIKNNDHLSDIQEAQLVRYLELLHEWNQVMNLTAVRDIQEMVFRHILDSLSIAPYVIKNRLIDVGTGAGLPGIPLAILFPQKKIYLLESIGKKARFLTEAMTKLQLKNVTIIHERAEKFHPQEKFDYVVTRAFSSLKEMLSMTKHLVKPTGEFLAMKGVYPEVEIKAIPRAFKVIDVHELKINGFDHARCLVRIRA